MTLLRMDRRISLALAWAVLASPISAGDWPSWRGPEENGVSRETGLPSTWSPTGENLIWKAPYGGRSAPVVLGGRVYVINLAGEGPTREERIMCLDAERGRVLWEHRFGVFLSDIPATRVGWASPVADPETGNVYAHGVQNTFLCLDRDGKLLWERSLHEEYGTITGYGGRTDTPVLDGDQVIVGFLNSSWGPQAKGGHRYAAFDKRTGEVKWWTEPGGPPLDTTYSTPVVTVVGGTRLIVAGNADGSVYAMKAGTGETVWGFKLTKRGVNPSVVAWKDLVFACHSEENWDSTALGRVVAIDATGNGDVTATHERWRIDGLCVGYASPALHDGTLYVVDNSANLHSIDAMSGNLRWTHSLGTVGKGSPVVAGGRIYIGEVNARFLIVEPKESSAKTLSEVTFQRPDGTVVEINGSPAVANGRVYFATRDELYAIGIPEWKGETGTIPPRPEERAASEDDPPTHLQVFPADLVLAPGGSARLEARLFNERGQPIRACSPTWTVKGVKGLLDTEGKLTIPPGSPLSAGTVEARSGALSAEVRVRVVPEPPLSFDFEGVEDGKPPAGWIGAGGKFAVAAMDGGKVLKKLSADPRFLHGETFFGRSEWRSYTISADVRATEKRRNLPNIGLVNSRYSLLIMGNTGELRIVGWIPEPRVEAKVKFDLRPDVWYRMRFRVDVEGGKGIARGKAWPRGEAEPEAWSLELEDPAPYPQGSPGLQAYSAGTTARSPGAEVFFDNIEVVRN
jgi:outer membrane protein assembly factor BamB